MSRSEIEKIIHAWVTECEEEARRQFEEAIAGMSPIEQTVMRRLREKVLEAMKIEDELHENAVLYGGGSKRPKGAIRARST